MRAILNSKDVRRNQHFFLEVVLWIGIIVLCSLIPQNTNLLNILIVLAFFAAVGLSFFNKLSLFDLGIRNNYKKTLFPWLIISLVMLFIVFFVNLLYPEGIFVGFTTREGFIRNLPFYALIGAFCQEFVFRGYFYRRASTVLHKNSAISTTIIIFTLFHLPHFLQLYSSLILLSAIAGIVWTLWYAKYPNLILASLSHAIVGGAALLLLRVS